MVMTAALLLRAVDYGEADRVVTLFTRDVGKGSFIARGARRSKRRFAGALEPLCALQVELGTGRGPLGVLVKAEVTRAYPRILGELSRMQAGFFVLELLRELSVEHAVDDEIFCAATEFLGALDEPGCAPRIVATSFALRLLSLLGFAPQLGVCGLCGRVAGATRPADFDPDAGHLVCQRCGGASLRLDGEARAHMQAAQTDAWLDEAQKAWALPCLQVALRATVAFTEHRLGRSLQTARLLEQR